MTSVCNPRDLMAITINMSPYPTFSELTEIQIQNSIHNDMTLTFPTAPYLPDARHELLAWFICDKHPGELTPELVTNLESQWFDITGHPFSRYDNNDGGLFTVIQNLQYRERGLTIIYTNGIQVNRTEMMKLHSQFFDEFECRISDFITNDSFKLLVDSVLSEKLV